MEDNQLSKALNCPVNQINKVRKSLQEDKIDETLRKIQSLFFSNISLSKADIKSLKSIITSA